MPSSATAVGSGARPRSAPQPGSRSTARLSTWPTASTVTRTRESGTWEWCHVLLASGETRREHRGRTLGVLDLRVGEPRIGGPDERTALVAADPLAEDPSRDRRVQLEVRVREARDGIAQRRHHAVVVAAVRRDARAD